MRKLFRHKEIVGGIFAAAIVACLVAAPHVFALVQNFSGYAWSSNVGWISLKNTGHGDGVVVGDDNFLTGYAWSSNVGWIKFGGLSGFPSGSGTTASNAKVVGTTIVGWARACEGMTDGTNCSGTGRADGWDGWVSLSGSTYGVTFDAGQLGGYAWGGEVVGWVNFAGGSATCRSTPPRCTDSTHISFTDTQCVAHPTDCVALNGPGSQCVPGVDEDSCVTTSGCLSINSDVRAGKACVASGKVHADTVTTLYWQIGNAENCSLTRNGAAWLSGLSSSDQRGVGKLSVPTTYTLSCDSTLDGGGTYTATAVINIVPEYEEI